MWQNMLCTSSTNYIFCFILDNVFLQKDDTFHLRKIT